MREGVGALQLQPVAQAMTDFRLQRVVNGVADGALKERLLQSIRRNRVERQSSIVGAFDQIQLRDRGGSAVECVWRAAESNQLIDQIGIRRVSVHFTVDVSAL